MLHRIGAIAYVLWGILHLLAASEAARLAFTVDGGAIQGRLLQNAWGLAVFALVATVIAITMNWRNSRAGYWINLVDGAWVDEENDDQCYDDDTNLLGQHAPTEATR